MALITPLIGWLLWTNPPARVAKAAERKVLFYQDSMHPWVKSDQPGKCTICAMDLTPIYEGQQGFGISNNLVVLSSNGITVLNVQAEAVQRRALKRSQRVAGTLDANETTKTIISAPAPGRIQALAVEYAGVEVQEGQTLITFFSPELQQRRVYFRATTNQRGQTNDLSTAVFKADPFSAEIVAPQSGVVLERKVYQGQYVAEGDRLLTLVDASMLWFNFDVYESQLPWLAVGQSLEVKVPSIPGKVFLASISFLEPSVNEVTRTVKARADIRNPMVAISGHNQRLLKFGMYAEGRIRAEAPDVLAVPRSAVLYPGGVAYVYLDKSGGAYEQRRVKLGRQGDDLWEILSGLEEGDRVVTSGNVLVDAQAQINRGSGEMEVQPEDASVPMTVVDNEVGSTMDLPKPATDLHSAPVAAQSQSHKGMSSPMRDASMANSQTPTVHPQQSATQSKMSPSPRPVSDTNASTTNRPLLHRQSDLARMAIRDEMWRMRLAAMAEGDQQTNTEAGPLILNQQLTLNAFLAEADGISRALAADDLAHFNQQLTKLSAALTPLQKELAAPHRWANSVQRLATLSRTEPAKDLEAARVWFLPFSTAMVDLAKQLRTEVPALAGLKIYHCPMAPKPGLWLQLKGPLRNPYFGAKMLTCGEEVGLAASGANISPTPSAGNAHSNSPQ